MADTDLQAPDMSAVMAAMAQAQQSSTPMSSAMPLPDRQGAPAPPMPTMPAPQPAPQQQQAQGPPSPRPILLDLISGLIHPQAQNAAGARPTSRTDVLEHFLGNFVTALGQGFANAGHGPGAAMRGAGAAIGAPYQQAVGQYQLGQQAQQQQAGIQQQQAETQRTQAQTQAMPAELQAKLGALTQQPRFDGDGKYLGVMNDGQYTQYLKGKGAAQINASNRMSVEQLKAQILLGQVKRVEDYRDPQTGQMGKMAYNLRGEPMGVLSGSMPSTSYLPKSTSTVDFKEDENGNIVALPKTSTSGVQLPKTTGPGGGNNPAPPASTFPRAAGGGSRVVLKGKVPAMVTGTGPDGRQIAGTPEEVRASGGAGVTKLEAADASKVSIARQMTGPGGLFGNVESDLAAFKPEELSAIGARWHEFQNQKMGMGDPRYAALRTDMGLLSTALMQAHVGSKGGEQIMEHFANLANAGKMNGDVLKSAIATERRYVEEKAMRPGGGRSPQPAAVDSLIKKYGGT